jgi:hypothetical protein
MLVRAAMTQLANIVKCAPVKSDLIFQAIKAIMALILN